MDNNRTFGGFTDINQFQNQYENNNPYPTQKKTSESEHAMNLLTSTGQYAGAGASIGSLFNPGGGTIAGAIIGGTIGLGKGIYDIFNTDSKEEDMSKQYEKIKAKLDEVKFSELNSRRIGNDMRTSQAMQSINKNNLTDYISDIQNPYA